MFDDFEDDRAVERLTNCYLDPDYDPLGRHVEPEEEPDYLDPWEDEDDEE